jgi:uncharacterized BrkB/YihY/UPF0761 family membrane protein
MLDILKTYFNYDIITDGSYDDTRVYLFKLFVECGLVGVLIYLLMFFYALRLSQKLISFYQKNNQVEYIKMLLLRYAFIVFFVSYMVQISSFYYLIIMGLIIGKLNALANKLSR